MKQIKEAINDLKNTNLKSIRDEILLEIQPYVMMRWLYGSYDSSQILNLNNIVNVMMSSNYRHPLLSFYLMSAITNDEKCKWIKPLKKINNNKKELLLISEYYKCSLTQAKDYLKLLSDTDVEEIKSELGYEK